MTSVAMKPSEIVQICQNAMAIENATVQSFRSLFLTVEAVALGVATVLISVRALGTMIVGVTIIGLFVNVCWYWQLRQRTRMLDEWQTRVYDNTRGTQVSEYFDRYRFTGLHIRSIRLWFDILTPLCIVILWVALLSLASHT
jgi:hypothetical protein